MNNGILTRTGQLKKKLLPAVYLDTSVVIDYWATEGLERDDAALNGFEKHEWPLIQVLREIMRSERRIEKVVEIRKKVTSGTIRATPVVSPLALLELVEWYACYLDYHTLAGALAWTISGCGPCQLCNRGSIRQIDRSRGRAGMPGDETPPNVAGFLF